MDDNVNNKLSDQVEKGYSILFFSLLFFFLPFKHYLIMVTHYRFVQFIFYC